jgi:hypothetical protein
VRKRINGKSPADHAALITLELDAHITQDPVVRIAERANPVSCCWMRLKSARIKPRNPDPLRRTNLTETKPRNPKRTSLVIPLEAITIKHANRPLRHLLANNYLSI